MSGFLVEKQKGEGLVSAAQYEKSRRLRMLFLDIFPFIGLIFVLIFFGIVTKGGIYSWYNVKSVFSQSFLFIIGGLGVSFLLAQGSFDLSMASVIALSAILGARIAPFNTALGVFVTIGVATLIGLLNGLIYSEFNLNTWIHGLAINFMFGGLLYTAMGKVSNVPVVKSLTNLNNPINEVAILIIVSIIVIFVFNYTVFGKHCKAIGGGVKASEQSGVNVKRVKMIAFVISGFIAGIVAVLSMIRNGAASDGTGNMFHFNVMVCMVLGGVPVTGGTAVKLRGIFIGAITVTIITIGMVSWGISARAQELVKGILFVAILVITTKIRNSVDHI